MKKQRNRLIAAGVITVALALIFTVFFVRSTHAKTEYGVYLSAVANDGKQGLALFPFGARVVRM